jgi:hypothetical protein
MNEGQGKLLGSGSPAIVPSTSNVTLAADRPCAISSGVNRTPRSRELDALSNVRECEKRESGVATYLDKIEFRRAAPLLWLAPVLPVLLFWPRLFPLDDAYITLYNARSLLENGDHVFGGSPLLGASSGLHLLCVAFIGTFIPLPTASLTICAICSCLYGWGLWRLRPSWAFVAVGLLSSFIPIHLLNGLETSMALAAVVWAFVLADSKWLPLLLGLLPYIRPDLLLLAAPLALRQLRSGPSRVVGLGLVTALPFAIWYYCETGLPFPNTAQAKTIFFGEYLNSPFSRLELVGKALFASYMVLLPPGVIGLLRSKAGWCGLFYMTGVLAIAFVALPGSLHFNDSRYLATFVPILCYGLAALPQYLTYALAAASVVTGATSLIQLKAELSGTGQWFDGAQFIASLPSNSTVLVHDIGVAAWLRPEAKLVDVVGLKSPSSVAIMKKHRVRSCQWGPALSEIARRSHAQYVAVLQVPLWECVGTNLRQAGWTLVPVYRARMTVFALTPPSPNQRTLAAGDRTSSLPPVQ